MSGLSADTVAAVPGNPAVRLDRREEGLSLSQFRPYGLLLPGLTLILTLFFGPLLYMAYLSVPVVAWFLYRTRWGLRV